MGAAPFQKLSEERSWVPEGDSNEPKYIRSGEASARRKLACQADRPHGGGYASRTGASARAVRMRTSQARRAGGRG